MSACLSSTDKCRCDLNGSTACVYEDVSNLAYESVYRCQREERLSWERAARRCLREGLAEWGCPERQEWRRPQWEAAVTRRLLTWAAYSDAVAQRMMQAVAP